MSSSKHQLQFSYPSYSSTIQPEICVPNSLYNIHPGEFILAEIPSTPVCLPNSCTAYNNSIDMEHSDDNLELAGGFLEEIRPEDSVSQTFHYCNRFTPVSIVQ